MDGLKRSWRKTPAAIRKLLVFIIGWLVVLVGILLLVLPGPGWMLIFLGFAILATEFAQAKTVRDWLVAKLHTIINIAKKIFIRSK